MGHRILTYSLVIMLCILKRSYSGPVAIYRSKRDVDCTTSAANLKDVVRSVIKAQDMRLEAELIMKPYTSWEESLMSAPIVIARLGELAAILSAQGDLKHKQYTESFADTLMQVWKKASGSFSTANKNMDQIRLLTASMLSAAADIVTILFRDTATVNPLLRQRLSSLLSKSYKCISLAQSVEASFANTNHVIEDSLRGFLKKKTDVTMILKQLDISEPSRIKAAQSHKTGFEAAEKMFINGLDSLGKVKHQWEKMIHFFQMITQLESFLSNGINHLVESVKSVPSLPNYSSDEFVKDMMYIQASKVSIIAYLVNMISSTYCEVSQRYLMDQVSALGRLLTMTPSNPQFQVEREKLQSGCEEAAKSMHDLMISKKQEFDLSIEARVDAINCQLGAAIPPNVRSGKEAHP